MLSARPPTENLFDKELFDEAVTGIINDVAPSRDIDILGTPKLYEEDGGMLVKYKKEFTFFDKNKSQIGTFSVYNLIKYIVKDLESKNFLPDDDKNFPAIEGYICRIEKNKITLKNHNESPFMGDLEMLIILNNELLSFEKRRLQAELLKVDIGNRPSIEIQVKKFIFMLLNYTLQIIAVVSDKIKDDPERRELRYRILKYTVSIMFRITQYINGQIEGINKRTVELTSAFDKCMQMRQSVNIKMEELTRLVRSQKEHIDNLTGKIEDCQKQLSMKGGANSENESEYVISITPTDANSYEVSSEYSSEQEFSEKESPKKENTPEYLGLKAQRSEDSSCSSAIYNI